MAMVRTVLTVVTAALAALPAVAGAQVASPAPAAVVHAVLFYSPTCPHCHQVMTVDLPPLVERFGPRLRIATVNVASDGGQALYQATVTRFAIPESRLGVPTLVAGSRVLVGSREIPDEFPGIVERGLAAGGIGWPDVPEIRQALLRAGDTAARREAEARDSQQAAAPAAPRADSAPRAGAPAAPEPAAVPAAGAGVPAQERAPVAPSAPAPRPPAPPVARASAGGAPTSGAPAGTDPAVGALMPVPGAGPDETLREPSMRDRFLADPAGNSASVVVLLAMLVALGFVTREVLGRGTPLPLAPAWVLPVLAVAGLGVAGYLSFVELTGTRAVCGPVGDCNTVQQSEYARLFGVLPVGVLGMVGYVWMLGLWLAGRLGRGQAARLGRLGAWASALSATLFSVYLTFLEPFVIGATCAWCLSSAVIVTLLLLGFTPAVRGDLAAWAGARSREPGSPGGSPAGG